MRIRFEHPAVVTGTWENGHVRRELVRVPTEFEILEFTDDEAPLSFTVVDDASGEVMQSYRTVGGRQYKAWRWDKPDNLFYDESNLMNSVYTGAQFEFRGLADILKEEVRRVAKITQYRNIENAERKPLKREEAMGFSPQAVSCKKAPVLKGWQWLGPDTKEEVAEWHAKTAAIFSKIILVEGYPHVLSFEPCYRLTASGTSRGNRSGPASPGVASLAVYGGNLDGPVIDPATGFEGLSAQALLVGEQFFAANDRDGMKQFAEESGWGTDERPSETITVYHEGSVTADFLELETVRHARILYDRARLMVSRLRTVDSVEQYSDRPIDKADMLDGMEQLRVAILDWQARRNGTEHLAAPFENLLAEMIRWEEGRQKINSFDLLDQVKAFRVREDMTDVTFIPAPWNGPSP
jgi:hypothetical protein|nr:hypothetical protein [Neorhizobium tomejilense]